MLLEFMFNILTKETEKEKKMAKADKFAYEVRLTQATINTMQTADLLKLITYHFSILPYTFGSTYEEALDNLNKLNIGIPKGYFHIVPKDK